MKHIARVTHYERTGLTCRPDIWRFGFVWETRDGRQGSSGDMCVYTTSLGDTSPASIENERQFLIQKRLAEIERDLDMGAT